MSANWINGATAREATEQVTARIHQENPQVFDLLVGHGINWDDKLGAVFELYFDKDNPVAVLKREDWDSRSMEIIVGGVQHQITITTFLRRPANLA